jgi:hypothetical protein
VLLAACAADRSGRASYSGLTVVLSSPCGLSQLIGLISGVMTGVTAGAMGLIGAAELIAGLRLAAFFLADFFFAALRAGFFFAAFLEDFFLEDFFLEDFFFEDFFFATRFLEDFFFAFLVDFFFAAFFLAAMLFPFNVDRLSVVRATRRVSLRTTKRSDSHRTSW